MQTLNQRSPQTMPPTPGQIIARHQTNAPIDVVAIAKELGVNVWAMHMPANISGKIFRNSLNGGASSFSIAVNDIGHPLRQQFTIAHEIAHFVLHRSQLEAEDLIDDTMYRSGLSTREEVAADQLAAQIVRPMELIQKLIGQGVNDVQAPARRFQVSLPAMKIRLGIPVA